MADQSVINLDPKETEFVRYALGQPNWISAQIPDLINRGGTIELTEAQKIDVIILGDGYKDQSEFEDQLVKWLQDFYAVDVYDKFQGAFRIHALYTKSEEYCSSSRKSFYKVPIDEDGEVSSDGWWEDSGEDNVWFRKQLFDAVERFDFNRSFYPSNLDVGGENTVIHNQLALLCSNLVVLMLVRTNSAQNASGRTRTVPDTRKAVLGFPIPFLRVNVGFGSHSLHEFGHAFAYLEDEYISERGSEADRNNPSTGNLFTLSNLTFSDQLDVALWLHVSPWGSLRRQAAGDDPSPLVGWLWRGGEDDLRVWHAEYQCLMNGRHKNYAFTSDESNDPTGPDASLMIADLRWRNPPRYCLWCHEIVVARILEKTGQLASSDDPENINDRGVRWYEKWVSDWRPRYWSFFNVPQLIADREALYANPASEPGSFTEIKQADGSYLELWRSDLYNPFKGSSIPTSTPPPFGDDEELLAMMNT